MFNKNFYFLAIAFTLAACGEREEQQVQSQIPASADESLEQSSELQLTKKKPIKVTKVAYTQLSKVRILEIPKALRKLSKKTYSLSKKSDAKLLSAYGKEKFYIEEGLRFGRRVLGIAHVSLESDLLFIKIHEVTRVGNQISVVWELEEQVLIDGEVSNAKVLDYEFISIPGGKEKIDFVEVVKAPK
ncbi:MAG: hypothetical protein KBD78_06145 [Oligoflexales bacterium]|nr:hypothetical protein [Oligoflexales bacterium]